MKNIFPTIVLLMIISCFNGFSQSNLKDQIELNLSINYESKLEVQRGLPLIFDVAISNRSAIQAAIIKQEYFSELEENSEKSNEIDKMINGITLGSKDKPWYESIKFKFKGNEDTIYQNISFLDLLYNKEAIFIINAENTAHFSFGDDPGRTEFNNSKKIIIQAYFDGIVKNDEQISIQSNEVIIEFVKPDLIEINDFDANQLYFTSYYWIRRNECIKAIPYQEKYQEIGNNTTAAMTLDAEIKECTGDDLGALKSYQKAFNAFDQDKYYEAPVKLIRKIHELQEKLLMKDK